MHALRFRESKAGVYQCRSWLGDLSFSAVKAPFRAWWAQLCCAVTLQMERIFGWSPALINLLCLPQEWQVAGTYLSHGSSFWVLAEYPILEYSYSNYQNVFTGLLYLPEKEADLFPLKCLQTTLVFLSLPEICCLFRLKVLHSSSGMSTTPPTSWFLPLRGGSWLCFSVSLSFLKFIRNYNSLPVQGRKGLFSLLRWAPYFCNVALDYMRLLGIHVTQLTHSPCAINLSCGAFYIQNITSYLFSISESCCWLFEPKGRISIFFLFYIFRLPMSSLPTQTVSDSVFAMYYIY